MRSTQLLMRKIWNLSISAAPVDWLPSDHHVRRAGLVRLGLVEPMPTLL